MNVRVHMLGRYRDAFKGLARKFGIRVILYRFACCVQYGTERQFFEPGRRDPPPTNQPPPTLPDPSLPCVAVCVR